MDIREVHLLSLNEDEDIVFYPLVSESLNQGKMLRCVHCPSVSLAIDLACRHSQPAHLITGAGGSKPTC